MATTGLFGPHRLSKDGIDAAMKDVGAGVYALGHSADGRNLTVQYVGRSDSDLKTRLHQHEGEYILFKYGYLPDAKAAFERECILFHDFNPPDNKYHPDRPDGTKYPCPRKCGY
jgi:hypothetical protein